MRHARSFQAGGYALVGLLAAVVCVADVAAARAADPAPKPPAVPFSSGMRIIGVRPGPQRAAPKTQALAAGVEAAPAAVTYAHPVPPFLGFTPLVVLTTSDSRMTTELEWEHILRTGYYGNPLHSPADVNYTIGIFDSGATTDLVGYCDAFTLGFYDAFGNRRPAYVTSNVTTLGGASGEIDANLSQPVGYFAGGLSAIKADGKLDLTKLIGHTNTSVVVLPPEPCGDGPELPSVAGNPLLAFYTTVIRNDLPRHATLQGQAVVSPDLQIYSPGNPAIPSYGRKITMNVGGLLGPFTSASYYGDFEDFTTPYLTPTVLSGGNTSLSVGGAFFGTMFVVQGEASGTNPLQQMHVLVDTGAQTCIMSSGMAANLSLPITPDFYTEVLGVGGVQSNVPGYYIDYVKINALGGALEFSHVPFVIADLPSIDGSNTDGVMGMNLFWNRNLVFQPSLTTSGFLQVSDPPLQFAKADFNHDFQVDALDFDTFKACATGPNIPQPDPICAPADTDGDGDVDQDDFGAFQRCVSGQLTADVNCG
jgi:hypothetical protein